MRILRTSATPLAAMRAIFNIAWAGWRMTIPSSWRPLSIKGNSEHGSMMLGTAADALVKISWRRPTENSFNPHRWVHTHLKKKSLANMTATHNAVHEDFMELAWLPDKNPAWYGYSAKAGLLTEITLNASSSKHLFTSQILPSLRTTAIHESTQWSVFGASFETPAGFFLKDKRLNLGDIILQLVSKQGGHLWIRQIYPAQLALARRSLQRWLEIPPGKEFRRHKSRQPIQPLILQSNGRKLEGIVQHGLKQFPFPFGSITPLKSTRAIVHEHKLDRLFYVVCDTTAEKSDMLLQKVMLKMKRTQSPSEMEA